MDSPNLSLYFTTIQCSKVKIHVSLFLHPGASILYLSLFTLLFSAHVYGSFAAADARLAGLAH